GAAAPAIAPEPQVADASPSAEAAADQEPAAIADAMLSWGVKSSFRSYITSPIAKGAITLLGAVTGSGPYTWSNGAGSGTAQPDGTGLEIAFGENDGVHFQGHAEGEDYILDLAFTQPQITVTSATTAELTLDVDGRKFVDTTTVGETYSLDDVHFADLVLPSPKIDGTRYTWEGSSATMTADGLQAFGGFYDESTAALDPITFSAQVIAQPGEPEVPAPANTTTALTAKATSPNVGANVELSARVAPAGASGSVQFTQNGKNLGEAVPVANGSAATTARPTEPGAYTYGAVFTPSDPKAFRGSQATPQQVDLADPKDAGTLQWGVKKSFREYVLGPIAKGKIVAEDGAKQAANNGVFTFPQSSTTHWNGTSGTVQYAGKVKFSGHHGQMDVDLLNPAIVVQNAKSAEVRIPLNGKTVTLAQIDLTQAKRETLRGGAVKFTRATTKLAKAGAEQFFVNGTGTGPVGTFYEVGTALDDITFVIGSDSGVKPAAPTDPASKPKPTTAPEKPAAPASTQGAAAGSLVWSVSNAFAAYTTCTNKEAFGYQHCAKGSVETNGVGAGYLFPQAVSSSWDRASQTGTVAYSGSVAFTGYGMTMYNVANPSITVTGPTSATLSTGNSTSFGSGTYQLDLASGSKSVGANGEVTWSNVPVLGSLSSGGAGGSGSQSIGLDPLTFTVGAESRVSYGATAAGNDKKQYTAAATPPATTGVTVLTDADKIKPGGRIEIEASGFDPDDEGVLIVLYSDPIVLDDEATADENGVVRWSGTLPDDVSGEHTITIQGSSNAGAVIDIVEPKAKKSAKSADVETRTLADGVAQDRVTAAGLAPAAGMALWEWWASAAGLVAIAACMTLLTIRQRRSAG
ncbi:HtaA domain-containing protein, partial [Leucobacter chromiiresistens]